MSHNIISDDLPYEGPLGPEQTYVVRGSVSSDTSIDIVGLAVTARSLRDAAEAFGRWCREHYNGPARMILSIANSDSLVASSAHLDEPGYYSEHDLPLVKADLDLFERGPGAYTVLDREIFRDD